MRRGFLCLSLFLLITLGEGTLSKSGAKTSEKASNSKTQKSTKAKSADDSSDAPGAGGLEKDTNTVADILENHDLLDSSASKRNFIKLGYVTPWNGHGYDIAKWSTQKYTHISPVWFQLVPKMMGKELSCEFKGQHDIDRGWLKDLRKNNSEVQILPRFIFEGPDPELFKQFLEAETAQIRCADALVSFLQENQFEGCIFEFWLQVLMATQGQGLDFVVEMQELFYKRLHLRKLVMIVPFFPPIRTSDVNKGSYLPQALVPRIFASVDYVNLMTYDYSGNELDANAPMPWVNDNVEFFISQSPKGAEKMLLGLNYYGHCKGGMTDTIMGSKFLDLVRSGKPMYWDPLTEENILLWDDIKCIYPTKRSIERRLDYAEKLDLAGVAIWELGQGLNHFTEIL